MNSLSRNRLLKEELNEHRPYELNFRAVVKLKSSIKQN